MRIIDKNTDFYDFWQNIYRDDSVTFDRTDSFVLTKELMCEHLQGLRNRFHTWAEYPQDFILLQVCHTFWLFLFEVTKETEYGRPTDYTVELITTWKNYKKPRCLIKLDVVGFGHSIERFLAKAWNSRKYDRDKVFAKADMLAKAIDNNDYHIEESIDRHTIFKGGAGLFNDRTKIEKHIPLLKACGIANCVNSLDVFLAFEEYFSLEKTSTERTSSVGLTDVEKIGNHGFDTKTSFRGKRK